MAYSDFTLRKVKQAFDLQTVEGGRFLPPTNIPVVYGATTSGTAWRFLQLENKTVTIDLTDYPLPPLDKILGMLAWMIEIG